MSKARDKEALQPAQLHFDPLEGMLCHELRRTTAAVVTMMTKEFSELGLTPGEATLLTYIGANPDCTQSDISRAYRNKATNLVPMIARLQRDGVLMRASGEGRTIALTLSKKGVLMLAKVQASFTRIEEGLSLNLAKSMQANMVGGLRKVSKNACHYGKRT